MQISEITFGKFCRKLRVDRKLTLREFCKSKGHDAGNVSGIETGRYSAPLDYDFVVEYAKSFGLQEGDSDWLKLFELWAKETSGVTKNAPPEIMDQLPVLFRTTDNKEPSDIVLEGILKKLGGTA